MIETTLLKNNFVINFRSFYELMKPRVMSLVIFTCVVGLIIAPQEINIMSATFSLIAVAIGAGSAGALNMWYESDIDVLMKRTCLRPIPTGKISKKQALIFGTSMAIFSILMLYIFSNFLSALMLLITILFYVFIYTIWLKQRTPQNIVIGGAAGAFPPIIGWTIAMNSISLEPIFLFLIIFFWTPSHFWALSLYKIEDYSNAKIPMLPLVSGEKITKINIFVYAIILLIVSIIPYFLNYFGIVYLLSSVFLGIYYVYLCYSLLVNLEDEKTISKKIFIYSILYLFLIFTIMLIDKVI